MLKLSRLIFLIMTSYYKLDQIRFRANRFHPPEVQLFNQSNEGLTGSDLTHLRDDVIDGRQLCCDESASVPFILASRPGVKIGATLTEEGVKQMAAEQEAQQAIRRLRRERRVMMKVQLLDSLLNLSHNSARTPT